MYCKFPWGRRDLLDLISTNLRLDEVIRSLKVRRTSMLNFNMFVRTNSERHSIVEYQKGASFLGFNVDRWCHGVGPTPSRILPQVVLHPESKTKGLRVSSKKYMEG